MLMTGLATFRQRGSDCQQKPSENMQAVPKQQRSGIVEMMRTVLTRLHGMMLTQKIQLILFTQSSPTIGVCMTCQVMLGSGVRIGMIVNIMMNVKKMVLS